MRSLSTKDIKAHEMITKTFDTTPNILSAKPHGSILGQFISLFIQHIFLFGFKSKSILELFSFCDLSKEEVVRSAPSLNNMEDTVAKYSKGQRFFLEF